MAWQHHLFVFNRRNGAPLGDLAGLDVFLPPRRAHRMRRRDSLLIYLHQEGNAPLSAREQRALLEKLSARYFSSGGSVTAALKELAGALNSYFLNRNRKLSGQGKHAIGWLALGVWRGNMQYVALSGPMHAVFLGETTRHYHDPQISGRGLGVSRSPRVYFASAAVQPGDALLLMPHLPAAWEGSLHLDASRKISPLLRRMSAYSGDNLEGVLVQVRPGEGEVKRTVVFSEKRAAAPSIEEGEVVEPAAPAQREKPAQTPPPRPTSSVPRPPQATDAAPHAGTQTPPPAAVSAPEPEPQPQSQSHSEPEPATASPTGPRSEPRPHPARRPAAASREGVRGTPSPGRAQTAPQEGASARAAAAETPPAEEKPSRAWSETLAQAEDGLRRPLAAVWRAGERALGALGGVFGRLTPSAEEVFSLPRSFMALSAIAVPLVVVTVAVVVFVRRGRLQQFQGYMARAKTEAAQALQVTEPITRHNALTEALNDVLAAETYYSNEESRALRQQLISALDELDGVQRLDFLPVSDRLPAGVVVKRLLVQGPDMYALDATTGAVYHLRIQGKRYVLDNTFQCGPGEYASRKVKALVDIASLPSPRSRYKVVGVDAQAFNIMCAPGEDAQVTMLPPAVPKNWQHPVAVGYQTGDLYVLDTGIGAVEVVGMSATGFFDTTPYNYFTGGTPNGIETAIEMAVQRGGLYLLHQDGQMTRCEETGNDAVHCVAQPYNDTRPGRSPGPVIPNTRFTQMFLQPPPDPSLYILDMSGQAIYRFSLQLQFVTQYRPQEPLEAEITAFAVDADARVLFVAAGRRIYQAPLE